jgi:hypothetical protein
MHPQLVTAPGSQALTPLPAAFALQAAIPHAISIEINTSCFRWLRTWLPPQSV